MLLSTPQSIFLYLSELARNELSADLTLHNGERSAKIFLTSGKILWAYASGQGESFRTILLNEYQIPKAKLLAGLNASRKDGKRDLDDILLTLGINDAELRGTIIRRHTRAALETIKTWGSFTLQLNYYPTTKPPASPGFTLEELQTNIEVLIASSLPEEKEVKASHILDLPDILQQLQGELPHLQAAMIIDSETGMPICTSSQVKAFNFDMVGAFYRDLMKAALEANSSLEKTTGPTRDILEVTISSEQDYIILKELNQNQQLLYLLLSLKASIDQTKKIIDKYIDKLNLLLK